MISAFVASYGYLAVFVGTLFEGETILLAAGFAAHRGLLDWRLVALLAMLGATIGDQLAFLLGRWKGAALLARFPALAQHKPRIDALLQRRHVLLILGVRFLYGLRIAGPVLLGSSGVPPLRFALLNAVGAALWATLITGTGYAFGAAINAMLDDMKRIEEVVMVLIVVCGLAFCWWRRRRSRALQQAPRQKR